jgi:hypothetical protein
VAHRRRSAAEWVSRYGLALCCVVAPLLFALIAFNGVLFWLTPNIAGKIPIVYAALETKQIPNNGAKLAPATTPDTASKGDSSKDGKATEETTPDPKLLLRALQYRGEARYAAASAFIYLASAAVLLFSLMIVPRRLSWRLWLPALIAFFVISCIVALYNPPGRELIVEKPLNAAEQFAEMSVPEFTPPKTGDMVSRLVSINTIVALVPIGMFLLALAALSIRDPGAIPDADDLKLRRQYLRIGLALGSALFVIGVLANKVLVAWPLSLISKPQEVALEPLAQAVTLQLGAMGTIAIIAAFGPAIMAWWLDVQRYRSAIADISQKPMAVKDKAGKAAVRAAVADSDDQGDELSDRGPLDEFVFAPLSTISGIIAALAPLLASPVVDAIRSLLK